MEFLSGREVLSAVVELAESGRGPIRAAVAYVGRDAPEALPLGTGDVIVINGSDNAVAAGATDPRAVQRWLEAGVRVVNHRWLHAKVFVNQRTAIIGSANLSERARSGAIVEAAVRTTRRDVVTNARAFIDELIRGGGEDIDEHWTEHATQIFPSGPVPPLWEEPQPALVGPFRLWLGWWNDPRDWTLTEQREYEQAVTESAAAFRPRARFQPVGMAEGATAKGFFQRGDVIVMLGVRNARLVEFHTLRQAGQGRRQSWMALYRRDTRLRSVTNASVRRALEAIGVGLPSQDAPDYGRWLDDPAERAAVLDLWQSADPGSPSTALR
jgi:hypothetical protein